MENKPTAGSQMLIRRPAGEVYEALVNPENTTKFWFTESSGRRESGKTITWTWGQFGVSGTVSVKELKQDQLITFEWPSGENGSTRTVEITFESKSDETTFVQVVESGFSQEDEQLIKKIAGQTEGWTLVLSALKAWLEHGINLNLIGDHKPSE